ncbi:response regulator [Nitrolancea hollandica]|uniref:Two component transcriptional regulator, LuxR family n=1 Tax=Nitrolancea hollandica Lb TaxID=1129897 RepID=I4EIF5_9BACT|nr:response regulator transcription factor [Nitrolancea hollandica]CCF84467.1 Two component transcriptional regulator, LuxR family [Nitrolancea hollandica Lb]
MIRILLVDDHASFRQPLAFMLNREPDFTVVAQAGSLAEARGLLNEDVDVAVVDLVLPDGNGATLVRDLRTANSHSQVLVLTASIDRRDLARAVEAGASGVMNKSASIAEIISAIRGLSAGEQLMSPRELVDLLRLAVQQREQDRDAELALGRLTPREREVLQALAEGLNDREIGQQLHVSTETVRTHMVNILGKLGVESRLQALVYALRHGAVTID